MTTLAKGRLLQGSLLDEQIRLEEEAIEGGIRRYNHLVSLAIDRGDASQLKPVNRLIQMWLPPLIQALGKTRRAYNRGRSVPGSTFWGPMLCKLGDQKTAVVALSEIMSVLVREQEGIEMTRIAYIVGRAIQAEANLIEMKRDSNARASLKKMGRHTKRIDAKTVNWWARKQLEEPFLSRSSAAHIGRFLIWQIVFLCMTPSGKPAFICPTRRRQGKKITFMLMHHDIFNAIESGHELRRLLRPKYLPMLVPPYKWSENAEGGYIRIRTPLVIKPQRIQKEALEEADLSRVYDAIDALGAVPLQVNRTLVDMAEEIYERGGGEMGIPRSNPLPMPERLPDTAPKEQIREVKRQRSKIWSENASLVGRRTAYHSMMSVATRYRREQPMYYPHQLDFRGRLYPVAQYLNWQGPDLCRGVLQMHEAKPLTPRGLWWLKVHLASTWGMDKVGYDDRVAWTEANHDHIVASAADPQGYSWWQQADGGDAPWQMLAACMAYRDYHLDPSAPIACPAQVDGTCNGLQHYAALGLDESAAAAVNLLPCEQPRSIYLDVAGVLSQRLEADGTAAARKILPHVGKPLVKTTVLAKPYGITVAGAREYIRTNLAQALGYDLTVKSDYLEVTELATYATKMVLEAVDELVPSASRIQGWIEEACRRVSGLKKHFGWTTPLGFPVVQPYMRGSTENIEAIRGKLSVYEPDGLPKTGKQVRGSSPNYIHSMDATHLMMVALACRRHGLQVLSVHDSLAAHPNDMDDLQWHIRDRFVALYSTDQLANLRDQLLARHDGLELPELPERGRLDIEQVREAAYMFS